MAAIAALCGGGCLAEPPGSFAGDSGIMVLEITALPHCQGVTNLLRVHSTIVDDQATVDDRFVDDYACRYRELDMVFGALVETPPLPLASYRIVVELVDPTTDPAAVRASSPPLDVSREAAFGGVAIGFVVE